MTKKKVEMVDYMDMLGTPEIVPNKDPETVKEDKHAKPIEKPLLGKGTSKQHKSNKGLMDDYFNVGFGTNREEIISEQLQQQY